MRESCLVYCYSGIQSLFEVVLLYTFYTCCVCQQRKTKYLISKSRHCHRHCVDIVGKNMAPNLSAVRLVLYFPIVWHSAPKLLSILILAAISKILCRTQVWFVSGVRFSAQSIWKEQLLCITFNISVSIRPQARSFILIVTQFNKSSDVYRQINLTVLELCFSEIS